MNQETLTLIIIYYTLCTVIGGLLMSWRFLTLRREAVTGAFAGFGAGLLGFGLPGVGLLWFLTPPKAVGLEGEATEDVRHQTGFRFETNVLWSMGAFTII